MNPKQPQKEGTIARKTASHFTVTSSFRLVTRNGKSGMFPERPTLARAARFIFYNETFFVFVKTASFIVHCNKTNVA